MSLGSSSATKQSLPVKGRDLPYSGAAVVTTAIGALLVGISMFSSTSRRTKFLPLATI